MRVRFAFVALLVLLGTSLFAEFPADYLPDGAHPRLWLNQSRLENLQAARTADTATWQCFSSEATEYLTELPWNGPQYAVPHMALMYKLTGENQWAVRGIELLRQVAPPADQSDVSKSHMGYFALGYDWLHDHPAMTTAIRAELVQKAEQWSDWVWVEEDGEGIVGNGQDTDFVIGTGVNHLMLGCAFYGDSASAQSMLDRGWWMWERGMGSLDPTAEQWTQAQPVRRWVLDAIGGHFYVGLLYFNNNESYMLSWYWETLRTACGYDVNVQEPELAPFWGNCIRTVLDLTDPPRKQLFHTSDWQDPNDINTLSYFTRAMLHFIDQADQAGDRDMAAYGRSYLQQVDTDEHGDCFAAVFFEDVDGAQTDPFSGGRPLSRLSGGQEFLFFRDSWGESARWGLFSGQAAEPADHQNEDTGSFMLWREDDYLTKPPRTYPAGIDYGFLYNCLTIENGMPNGSTRMTGFAGKAKVERARLQDASPQFVYAMVQADDQWNEDPNEWESVQNVTSYRRHFFWAGDHCVVFDRLRTNKDCWSQYRLHARTEPQLNGATVSQLSENGKHMLLQRTLEPAGASLQIINETTDWSWMEEWEVVPEERRWHTLVTPPAVSRKVNYLHAIEMGPATMTGFSANETLSDGTNSGVRLGSWVVVFNAEESDRNEAAYTVTGPVDQMQHLVGDLAPGVYTINVGGIDQGEVTVTSADQTALFSTEPSGGHLTVQLVQRELSPSDAYIVR